VAGQVSRHVPRQQAAILVVAAAGCRAGDERELALAEIELLRRLGAGALEPQARDQAQADAGPEGSRHASGSLRVSKKLHSIGGPTKAGRTNGSMGGCENALPFVPWS